MARLKTFPSRFSHCSARVEGADESPSPARRAVLRIVSYDPPHGGSDLRARRLRPEGGATNGNAISTFKKNQQEKDMSQQTAKTLNQAKAQAFGDRMLDTLNKAAAALMISVGHRTGLFDALVDLPHATSERIAKAAGLNERYVREWLGAMVTARIVDYDPAGDTYFLPREHAEFLTRAASPNNLAVTAQFIPVLASVENEIVECFRNGGGVPYSSYPRFHEVMAEESN